MSQESTGDPPQLINSPPQMRDLPGRVVRLEDVQLPVDILLITVKDIEFLNCFFYLEDPVRIYDRDSVGFVYTGHMGEHQEKKLNVALVRSFKGGAVPGGSLTTVRNAVPALNPKAVFSVGICTGLNRNKSKLGDVVVSAKLITSSHRPPAKKDMANLLKHAGDGWQEPLRDPQPRKVKVHCDGEFVSGLEVTEQLVQQYPEAIAAESEGEGGTLLYTCISSGSWFFIVGQVTIITGIYYKFKYDFIVKSGQAFQDRMKLKVDYMYCTVDFIKGFSNHYSVNYCNLKFNIHFKRVWMRGGTNVNCQLKFRLFVSCQLSFRPFVSCQLIDC